MNMKSDIMAAHLWFVCLQSVMASITDVLTPDDLRVLIESIDEDSRKGGFQRIFPTPSTHKYLQYFEAPRYYNLFLDTWCQRYNRIEAKGLSCNLFALLYVLTWTCVYVHVSYTTPSYQILMVTLFHIYAV